MGKGTKKPERAKLAAVHRTIPDSRKSITVNLTGSQDLAACVADDGPDVATSQCLCGVFIYLSAETADVTIQRSNAPATAGDGFVLVAGSPPQEFFVDPDGATTLYAIAAAAATLHITWDSEQVGA